MYQLLDDFDRDIVLFEGTKEQCEEVLQAFCKYGIPAHKFYMRKI